MASIADKSRSKELIQNMQNLIETAPSVPLSQGKISIYKDEIQTMLRELAAQIDIELKTYHEVNDRKGKLISEAKKEAERIILEAEQTASRVRVSKSTTGVSPLDVSKLNQEELDSLSSANEIYAASLIYTDEMLTEVTDMINTAYENIRGDYEIVMQVMQEKLQTINSNREELMVGLQEMDAAERSQQILEIGQLLSNELYMSRMKAKMDSDQYEDGSVQLSLELVEEQEEKARLAQEKAERAQAALEQMTAERDALKQTVWMMKNEGMAATVRDVKDNANVNYVQPAPAVQSAPVIQPTPTVQSAPVIQSTPAVQSVPVAQQDFAENTSFVQPAANVVPETASDSEGQEYDVIYVSEDELEEGEEYEVEYVDDEEYEKIMHQLGKDEKEQPKESEESQPKEEQSEAKQPKEEQPEEEQPEVIDIPLIPRFKKVQKVADISAAQVENIKNAPDKLAVKETKSTGFIDRAVKQKEQEQLEDTITVENESIKENTDEDMRVDDSGKEYIQATMKFDEDFEITEF